MRTLSWLGIERITKELLVSWVKSMPVRVPANGIYINLVSITGISLEFYVKYIIIVLWMTHRTYIFHPGTWRRGFESFFYCTCRRYKVAGQALRRIFYYFQPLEMLAYLQYRKRRSSDSEWSAFSWFIPTPHTLHYTRAAFHQKSEIKYHQGVCARAPVHRWLTLPELKPAFKCTRRKERPDWLTDRAAASVSA